MATYSDSNGATWDLVPVPGTLEVFATLSPSSPIVYDESVLTDVGPAAEMNIKFTVEQWAQSHADAKMLRVTAMRPDYTWLMWVAILVLLGGRRR